MEKKKTYFLGLTGLDLTLLIIIGLISALVFFYKISDTYKTPIEYNFYSDFGRDLLKMYEILHGKPTLIGPQLSFAGLHMAPYQFYIFAPFLLLGGYDYRSVLYANALFFLIGLLILFVLMRKKMGGPYVFLSILWLVSTPYIILASRSPGNGFSYLIFLAIVISYLLIYRNITPVKHFLVGIADGIVVNFHPINLITIIPTHLIRFKKKYFIPAAAGFFLTFLPVILFDVRHNFVITKFLFDKNQYRTFFGRSNFSQLFSISSFSLFNSYTAGLISLTITGLAILVILLTAILFKKNKIFLPFVIIALCDLVFLRLLNKGATHYFLPTLIFFQILFIFINRSFKLGYLLLVVLIGINLTHFPLQYYQHTRNLFAIENRFNKVLASNILPKTNLNVVLINDTYLSRPAYEYRFLLAKNNYQLEDEYSYNRSQYLLLVSEKGDINWQKETSWETDQFGKKVLLKKTHVLNYYYYLFGKK